MNVETLKVSVEMAAALEQLDKGEWDKRYALIGHCKGYSGNGVLCKDIYLDELKIIEQIDPLDFARCLIAGYEIDDSLQGADYR